MTILSLLLPLSLTSRKALPLCGLCNCVRVIRMLAFRYALPFISEPSETRPTSTSRRTVSVVVCAAKGSRPRYQRVWKTQKKFGTISKSAKLVECVKGLSNIKEEVYGALDTFIAWDLEFPLIVVKKALQTLEKEKEWKRIIQMAKWMLSKGQGRTLGTYLTLINALVEDGRVDEAEEIWEKVFAENLESTPRYFFEKMVALYYNRGMHDKLFEIFADMDELGITPTVPIVKMVGSVFRELGMMDKYQKLMRKYPPPKWEFQYIGGKRVKVRAKQTEEFNQVSLAEKSSSVDLDESSSENEGVNEAMDSSKVYMEAGGDELVNKNSRGMYEDADVGNTESSRLDL